MSKLERDQPRQDWQDHLTGHHLHKGEWKWSRIHHSWVFWVFFSLTIAAITYYITTVDFALAPRKDAKPSMESRMVP